MAGSFLSEVDIAVRLFVRMLSENDDIVGDLSVAHRHPLDLGNVDLQPDVSARQIKLEKTPLHIFLRTTI